MAIPSTPQNFLVQTGNRQNYISWDLSSGATSYTLQRSTDQLTYSTIASPTVTVYLDESVTIGTEYFYKVAAVNSDGTSEYTSAQSVVPAPTAEMSLGQLRLMCQQKADLVESQFITVPEWNNFINLAMYELYDYLIKIDPDQFSTTPYQFATDGSTFIYNVPDGATSYINGVTGASGYIAPPFYKLLGVDLSVNTSSNAWVTISKYNFIDRNKFIYPNTNSTLYGVFNIRYRLVGATDAGIQQLQFIPTPTGNQQIRVWYAPRLTQLLADTDITTIGFSGWLNYVIVRAAKYALDKEESDSSKLDQEILFLKERIESTAPERDSGRPDTISDVQSWGTWGIGGPWDYFKGGM